MKQKQKLLGQAKLTLSTKLSSPNYSYKNCMYPATINHEMFFLLEALIALAPHIF